ncbi:MAG: hypothetical protein ACLGPL_04280, partial [Acidobacteriota bacterium]
CAMQATRVKRKSPWPPDAYAPKTYENDSIGGRISGIIKAGTLSQNEYIKAVWGKSPPLLF